MVSLGLYVGGLFSAAALSQTPVAATSTPIQQRSPIVAAPTTRPATTTIATPASKEIRFKAYLTGYTYWDNTPPGSAAIARPIIHTQAGGTGTYADPITIAVGHSLAGGVHTLDYAPGTRFYLPYLKKYFIVEDICGDGETPELGPCHTGYQGYPWLDLWLGGSEGSREQTDACAAAITEVHTIIQNPEPHYTVEVGEVFDNGACALQFSDIPVLL